MPEKAAKTSRSNGPKHTQQELDARYHAVGKSVTIINTDQDIELAKQNKGKEGRPFKYPDSMMSMIAYIRYTLNMSYRELAGYVEGLLEAHHIEAPSYPTIWRRTGAVLATINQDIITIQTKDGKTHRLIADSTGLAVTNSCKWIEFKWNVKHNFLKLHILIDEESQKILAYRITDVEGGDAQQLPGMLDEALEKLGVPDETEPEPQADVSVELLEEPVEGKSKVDVEYVCDCGCGNTVHTEPIRRSKARRILATLLGDGGYDSRKVFSHAKKRGVKTVIRVRINAIFGARGVDRARGMAVLEQLGAGCNAQAFAKLSIDKRRKFQKEWMKEVGYGGRWMVEIVISAFKRVLGESVRAVKPEYILIEVATKIAVYNRRRDIMQEAIA